MSRAYRIKVRESLCGFVHGRDQMTTQIEWLQLLPEEPLCTVIGDVLQERGFTADGSAWIRRQNHVTVAIDAQTGAVQVTVDLEDRLQLDQTRTGLAEADCSLQDRERTERQLRAELRDDLQQQADARAAELDHQATAELEAAVPSLEKELELIVNRVTVRALKLKAAQIGEIKSISEDADAGDLTIVLEV